MDDSIHCPNCSCVLVENIITHQVYCKACGYSEKNESDEDSPSYIG